MGPKLYTTAHLDFQPHRQLHPSPSDWRDQVIYFLMVDRFDDNRPEVPPYDPATALVGRDPVQGGRFQGGCLRGITRRLDYIQGLGCTTIWLSPIFQNSPSAAESYHGYGIQDFLEVEPRFGTLEDLRELTAQAHARGMYVVLDIVLNHAGNVFSYQGGEKEYDGSGRPFPFGCWRKSDPLPGIQRGDAVWPIELQHPDSFKRLGNIRNWNGDEREIQDGDFCGLKELNINRRDVLNTLIKIYKYWILNADVDGFRLDTVKHMENTAVAIFCNAIHEYAKEIGKQNFFIFGEIIADDKLIESYLGRNARLPGTNERFPSLDAALDFPQYACIESIIKGFASPQGLVQRYERFHTQYTDHGEASRYFVTFIDNHDQPYRPHCRFMHGNPHFRQAVLAAGYLLTSQGIPCLYYGYEQGFDGGDSYKTEQEKSDAYVRECMFGGNWGAFNTTGQHFFNPEHAIYRSLRALIDIRQREPALRYGRMYFREVSEDGQAFSLPAQAGGWLAYSRILDVDEVLIVINLSMEPRQGFITVDRDLSPPQSVLRDLLRPETTLIVEQLPDSRACLHVQLPPHGMAIFKRE